jgi:enoyl-CoA hydratase/carnithine racemase
MNHLNLEVPIIAAVNGPALIHAELVVSEILPSERLLARAWELACQIVVRPSLSVHYARIAIAQELKKLMLENLGYGLALEGLGAGQSWPGAQVVDK